MIVKKYKDINSFRLKGKIMKDETCLANKRLCEKVTKSKNVSCLVCGNNESNNIVNIYGFNYVQCNNCSLVYIKNPSSTAEIEDIYNSDYYNKMVRDLQLSPEIAEYRVESIGKPKVSFIREVISNNAKTWVDIGCGGGEILSAAKDCGFKVEGIETNKEAVCYLRDHLGLKVTEMYITEDSPGPIRESDIVSLFGVLEHLPNPKGLINILGKYMHNGSYLIVEVPRFPSLSCLSQQMFPDLVNRVMAPPFHLSIFTEKSIDLLVEANNFSKIAVWHYGQDFYEFITTLATKIDGLKSSDLWKTLVELIDKFQAVIDENNLNDEMLLIYNKTI